MALNPASDFYAVGGTMSVREPSYVARKADHELVERLLAGEFCYVLTASQMGKSSLMVRAADRLRQQGVALAMLDLAAGGQNVTLDQWYDGLLLRVGQQLKLEDELEDYWVNNGRLGPCERFFSALRQVAMPFLLEQPQHRDKPRGQLVLFVDEIDNVRSLPFATDEFFAAIRECLNHRSQDPLLQQLAFCLLGIAMPAELIKDPNRTPFNIGYRVELTDFTRDEARHFLAGLDRSRLPLLEPEALLDRVLYWTHGHPYLTQQMFSHIARRGQECDPAPGATCVDRLCDELFLSARAREANDNLLFVRERLLRTRADLVILLDLYEQVLAGETVLDDEQSAEINQLRLAGIVRTEGHRLAVRNRIYREVFSHAWVQQVKPLAELEVSEGQRIRIRSNFTLGRTDANDLPLPDIKVSRRHALVQKQGNNELLLVDLGSRNGTFLNGQRVTTASLLRDKDRISIGPYRLIFHQPNAPRRDADHPTTLDRTVFEP